MAFNDQATFLIQVSRATGIDPRVMLAWMFQEGAFSGKEKGAYNYLNIMGPNGVVSYPDEKSAAIATVGVIHQPNMAAILNTAQAKPTPEEQIKGISFSPWDKGHYGGSGGVDLQHTYKTIFGNGEPINSAYKPPSEAEKIVQHYLNLSPGGNVGGLPPSIGNVSPVHVVGNAFGSILDFFNHLWDIRERIGFILAGAIIVILAIVLIGKDQASNTFTFAKGGE